MAMQRGRTEPKNSFQIPAINSGLQRADKEGTGAGKKRCLSIGGTGGAAPISKRVRQSNYDDVITDLNDGIDPFSLPLPDDEEISEPALADDTNMEDGDVEALEAHFREVSVDPQPKQKSPMPTDFPEHESDGKERADAESKADESNIPPRFDSDSHRKTAARIPKKNCADNPAAAAAPPRDPRGTRRMKGQPRVRAAMLGGTGTGKTIIARQLFKARVPLSDKKLGLPVWLGLKYIPSTPHKIRNAFRSRHLTGNPRPTNWYVNSRATAGAVVWSARSDFFSTPLKNSLHHLLEPPNNDGNPVPIPGWKSSMDDRVFEQHFRSESRVYTADGFENSPLFRVVPLMEDVKGDLDREFDSDFSYAITKVISGEIRGRIAKETYLKLTRVMAFKMLDFSRHLLIIFVLGGFTYQLKITGTPSTPAHGDPVKFVVSTDSVVCLAGFGDVFWEIESIPYPVEDYRAMDTRLMIFGSKHKGRKWGVAIDRTQTL